jgi:hypothetical protein
MKRFFEKREDWTDYKSFRFKADIMPMYYPFKIGDTVRIHWLYVENGFKYRLFNYQFGPIIKTKVHETLLTGIFVKQSGSQVYIMCGKKLICFEWHRNIRIHYAEVRTVLFEKYRQIHNQRRIQDLSIGMADELYTMGGQYNIKTNEVF